MTFISGLDLSERFYREAMQPLFDLHFAGTAYSAALIGDGSEVLGFDTEMSTDHDWGPRALIFLGSNDHQRLAAEINAMLSRELPREFMGYPTSFTPPDANDNGTQLLDATSNGAIINHRIEILTLEGFFKDHIDFDIDSPLAASDWLSFPQQKLATLTAGRIFHDQIGLKEARERFAYYPQDVWLYMLAAGWNRIEQEEHLMGRAGFVGDEIGSAIIGARLVRDIMRLCFLMERKYAPYQKWFGTAFAKLKAAPTLQPSLRDVLKAETWSERQQHLSKAYEFIAKVHNELAITPPLPTQVKSFFGRPFYVISMGEFSAAIKAQIKDEAVQRIAAGRLFGAIDQITDSTDIVEDAHARLTLRNLYQRH